MAAESTIRRIALVCGYACMGLIVFSTLSPIGLRPHVAGVELEHVAAFLAMGLFLGLACPRHLVAVALVVAAAVSLEAAQTLIPGRHGRIVDLAQKLVGGGLGLALAAVANAALSRLSRRPGAAPRASGARDAGARSGSRPDAEKRRR